MKKILAVTVVATFAVAVVILLSAIFLSPKYADLTPYVINTSCDASARCPVGFECISLPEQGTVCAIDEFVNNPCKFYRCPIGSQCLLLESYPPLLRCG